MPTAKKTAPKKKSAPKRAPAKAASATKVRRHKVEPVKSFKPARATEPFMTFKVTKQTVYWLILAGIVLCLGLWVTDINLKVQKIYDQVEYSQATGDSSRR